MLSDIEMSQCTFWRSVLSDLNIFKKRKPGLTS